ncbi:EamA family transporter [Tamaricihabitans halophyticus]|uniref:EamA family transporter n=1 Tax=Tamaricihabitans halophyticus TaxID=1262583 RepID=UPI001FB30DD0|nr:EamA family transporter [Tamaricihabitans halophyticus]
MATTVHTPPTSHPTRGTVLILASSLCFGVSGPIAKPAMQAGMTAEQVTAARIAIAALVLLIGVGLSQPSALRIRRTQWRLVAGYGLLGVSGIQLCYFFAVSRLPVGIALLLEYLSPVLVALWVRLIRRTVLPQLMWLGTGLAVLGLATMVQVWHGLRLDALGLLAGVAAACCSAAYFLIGERGAHTMNPLGLVTWGMLLGAVAVAVVSPPWRMPFEVFDARAEFGPWQPPVWALLLAVALLATVLAYLSGIAALRHLPPNVASVLALAEPVVATVAAWLLLGETLTPIQLVGAAVLLSGAAIVQRATSRPTTVAEPLPSDPRE